MAHQLVSLEHDSKVTEVFDTSDAGTGKTFVRIMAFAKRRAKKGYGKALVLAPRTLLRTAWENDFRKFAPHLKVVVCDSDNRENFDKEADAYIVNHDAVKWMAANLPDDYWDDFHEFIVDEPTAYKHKDSQRSKAAAKLARRKNWKHWAGMTMTPTSNGVCDIWHQVYLLDGGKRLGHQFYNFRAQVCTPTQVGRSKHAVRWEDKDGAEEAVYAVLQDMVIRHKLQDCVDLPPTHVYDVKHSLPKKVRLAYDQMELTQLLSLRGKKGPGKTLNAVNAAAVATKLLQICSGAVYDDTGNYHLLDTSRYELVLDMIEARKHSLVFFNWKHQRDMLTELAEKRGITFCVMDGSATDRERYGMVQQYQAGHYQTIFAHPKSAAHGLTLTKGTSTIWPGPTYDLELWKQGNARQARIGQKQKTEVIVVLAQDTIEEKVYDLLMGKNKKMTNLLDLMASLV